MSNNNHKKKGKFIDVCEMNASAYMYKYMYLYIHVYIVHGYN